MPITAPAGGAASALATGGGALRDVGAAGTALGAAGTDAARGADGSAAALRALDAAFAGTANSAWHTTTHKPASDFTSDPRIPRAYRLPDFC